MDRKVGVFRTEADLQEALAEIRALQVRFKEVDLGKSDMRFNYAMVRALELENMLELAEAVALGALARRESRGAHWRNDYPKRDDERFLRHTLVTKTTEGLTVSYKDVQLGIFDVKERTY